MKTVKFRSPFDGEYYDFKNQSQFADYQFENFNFGDVVFDCYGDSMGYFGGIQGDSVIISATSPIDGNDIYNFDRQRLTIN